MVLHSPNKIEVVYFKVLNELYQRLPLAGVPDHPARAPGAPPGLDHPRWGHRGLHRAGRHPLHLLTQVGG